MERPDWCPHKDCIFKSNRQNLMCVGKLPEPIKHNGTNNTHRLCFDERETGHGIHDLQMNWTDAWLLKQLLDFMKPPTL